MTNIVHLTSRRPSDAPDAAHVSSDQYGRPTYEFSGDYQLGGRTWTVRFWAFGWDDAEELAERWGLEDIGQVVAEGDMW